MPGNKTLFNIDWINPEMHPTWSKWLAPVKGFRNEAYCTKCCRKFSLSNMGMQAVKSHEQGKVHQKILKNENSQISVASMFKVNVDNSAVHVKETSVPLNNDSHLTTPKTKTLDDLVIKRETAIAEILWALRIIMKRDSFNSCQDDGYLFKKMFSDSIIARNFAMGPDKASYVINYGLAPYFNSLLNKQLLECREYVVCFDEALNKIAQKGQMDIHVRFWCNVKQQVCTRYLNSAFLTKSKAENLLESFKEALHPLSLDKLLQVSMDGPSVNWKFLRLLKSDLELGDESPKLLEIGSCGLHVIHGAFQTGHSKAGWEVNRFLRGLYYLFKDSPSRRTDYTTISGSSTFPKKFCHIRWVENVLCAERAILIFENVKQYLNENPRLPENISVRNVQNCLNNKLMLPQLAFFKMLAEEIQPFLIKFQTSQPLAPFLYSSLLEMTQNLLRRFVKKEIIENATTPKKLAAINLSDNDNLLTYNQINIGFSATKYLNKSKVSEKDKGIFKMECRKFLVATVSKIFEKSPLLYSLTKGISSLVPELIIKNPNIAQQRMVICLKILHESNRLNESIAENARKEFISFCNFSREKKQIFLDFAPKENRLDSFFSQLLQGVQKFENFWLVVKIILIISHGNATVESGFSINKGLLLENLNEESIVSQRRVYDFVISSGGIKEIEVNEKMALSVKGSRMRWSAALEERRKKDEEFKKKLLSKKRQLEKIKSLKSKKLKLSKEKALEIELLESEITNEENILKNM